MNDKTYNGWANHATWLVNLYIDNEGWDNTVLSGKSRYEAKELIKEYVDYILSGYDEEGKEVSPFMWDLMQSTLSDVAWYELADHYLAEAATETDE